MPKIRYVSKKFGADSLAIIEKANQIVESYQAQGYDLTLRQLYYQFVSRDWLKNTEQNYKRLGSIIADARLAGMVDWDAITDRTRNLKSNSHWYSPGDIIASAASSFAYDKWATQKYRPEVWVEKEALAGIVEGACRPMDVPFFSCRGYPSLSEVWAAAMRLKAWRDDEDQVPIIFHLGDHDPSGIDMSRDIVDRMQTFGLAVEFRRLALNMDQVRQYDPPPNPAKLTDSRASNSAGTGYIDRFGDSSWELDALDPPVITALISEAITGVRDQRDWDVQVRREAKAKQDLEKAAGNWARVAEFVSDLPEAEEDEDEDDDGDDT